jgi:hypothetical protein
VKMARPSLHPPRWQAACWAASAIVCSKAGLGGIRESTTQEASRVPMSREQDRLKHGWARRRAAAECRGRRGTEPFGV